MLSRVMQRSLLRGATVSKMIKPGNHTCFCGCRDGKHFGMLNTPSRSFQGHLGLDSTQNLVPAEYKESEQVSLWKEIKNKQEHALVLKS